MDSLEGTEWDILIAGTGIKESLLALALSRSGKRVLHIDGNDFYGASEAALSLQEAEQWANRVSEGALPTFGNASISRPVDDNRVTGSPKLSFSRAYTLSLSPQLIYSRSSLLSTLVSSKVYRQLDFVAVGNWWMYSDESKEDPLDPSAAEDGQHRNTLNKIPSGREDVFAADGLDLKAKRALMKFLRFIMEYEEQIEIWDAHRSLPFSDFLTQQFKLPTSLHSPLLALALSSSAPSCTTTEFALPRIARHLRSIGVFGPGFGSVLPKWGGLAEICQVACRANAVGGGAYVLGNGVSAVTQDLGPNDLKARLRNGENITTKQLAGSAEELRALVSETASQETCAALPTTTVTRSISIVSSSLRLVFPPLADGAPPPAAAVVMFPSDSLEDYTAPDNSHEEPVFIQVHSSDTGDCPSGQSVLYASTRCSYAVGSAMLDGAVKKLLLSVNEQPEPHVLWSLCYEQRFPCSETKEAEDHGDKIFVFTPPPFDLAFNDSILEEVRGVWSRMTGEEVEKFMVFEDRENYGEDGENDDEAHM